MLSEDSFSRLMTQSTRLLSVSLPERLLLHKSHLARDRHNSSDFHCPFGSIQHLQVPLNMIDEGCKNKGNLHDIFFWHESHKIAFTKNTIINWWIILHIAQSMEACAKFENDLSCNQFDIAKRDFRRFRVKNGIRTNAPYHIFVKSSLFLLLVKYIYTDGMWVLSMVFAVEWENRSF